MKIRCKVCGEPIAGRFVACGACETPHHRDCWTYAGGCSVFGCRKAEPVPLAKEDPPATEAERRRRALRAWIGLPVLAFLGAVVVWIVGSAPSRETRRGGASELFRSPAPVPPPVPRAGRRITPPTTEGIPLPFALAGGALVVDLPPIGNTAALDGARVRVHVTPATEASALVARELVTGRAIPLDRPGSWDVTALAGDRGARLAIVPAAQRPIELRHAIVWMSVGDPVPPPPRTR